jgi:hypothetical protein
MRTIVQTAIRLEIAAMVYLSAIRIADYEFNPSFINIALLGYERVAKTLVLYNHRYLHDIIGFQLETRGT